ncbi:hypothetical protein EJB05_33994, partial [Eragrostis curvula]
MAGQSLPKPIRCKAAVCRASGEPLVVEEIVVDPPRAYEVRIKIVCTSLCHTDITVWRSNVASKFPRIIGHEAFGVVESVGEHVSGFVTGDAVVPTFLGQCDACRSCRSSSPERTTNMCTTLPLSDSLGMRRDGTVRFRDLQGNPLNHCVGVSSFSQYTVVDVNQLVKLGDGVPPKMACLLGCGASTGVGAAWRLAKVEPGSSVAIFGLGTVGLAAVQGAKMCGASKIIGVDLNPDKEEVGKSILLSISSTIYLVASRPPKRQRKGMGVTDFINPSQLGETPVSEVIGAMTGGGVDYSFECIGVPSVMADAFRSTKMGTGMTIILGFNENNEPVALPSLELLHGKRVMGAFFGGIKPKTDIPILAKKCVNNELELERLVTHEVGLQDINTAFDLLLQKKSLRCIIWMVK